MRVTPLLRDMLAHRPWADEQLFQAAALTPAANADAIILRRLHHTLSVQRHFLFLVGGIARPEIRPPDAFSDVGELTVLARETHAAERAYLDRVPDDALEDTIEIPFPSSPLRITRAQALAQSAMHSQHHRAQNATRLRDIGGDPPTTDLILWYWLGRPQPRWADDG